MQRAVTVTVSFSKVLVHFLSVRVIVLTEVVVRGLGVTVRYAVLEGSTMVVLAGTVVVVRTVEVDVMLTVGVTD